jgi:hypothetical protein
MTLPTLVLALLLADVPAPEAGSPPPAPTPAATPTSSHVDPPSAAAARHRPAGRDPGAALRSATDGDPPIALLRSAATALALAEPERARAFVDRARWAGLLPELRVRLDRRFSRTESLDLSPSAVDADATPVGVDSLNDLRYEWRATWDLGRIVFNPDELAASTQALRMADVRREVEGAVIRLYFERRRLKAEAQASDATDTTSGVRLELRIQEIEAELDALTGGALSRWRATSHAGEPAATP